MKIRVTGVVQGVGFRPFIANLAQNRGITGTVRNTGGGVEIVASGHKKMLDDFARAITSEAPPQAHIAEIHIQESASTDYPDFTILPSTDKAGVVFVPVDMATCADCEKELFDESNRRYLYPFINCTQCGPRYSIIDALPYDRIHTTMQGFPMCPACQAEYDNPSDRRYHAQPNACPVCGPHVRMGALTGLDAVKEAARLVDSGEIIAMKGLGGYHLICDALNSAAIVKLRKLKNRRTKPLAVMCRDTGLLTDLPEAVQRAINSPSAPIVTVHWKNHPLSSEINPLGADIGLMKAYTPLHKILLSLTNTDFIVATSGNIQDEPIIADEKEAEAALGRFTSYFLHHNRPIRNKIDDSVAMYAAGEVRLLRRGRGYAPFPVTFPLKKRVPMVFAAGAHLKSTITFTKGQYAFVSGYIGDLDGAGTVQFYKDTFDTISAMLKNQPAEAVCDKHPGYFSTTFARELGVPLTEVQHHHAHMLSVMAEHKLTDNVIGLIMDGTGYGDDGTIWGGEIFALSEGKIHRLHHLEPAPQSGGDAAVKYPSRMAQTYLMEAGIWDNDMAFWCDRMGMAPQDAHLNGAMIKNRINTIPTSSAGRLFESVGAMVTGVGKNEYEAHSAMALEAIAGDTNELYPYEITSDLILLKPALMRLAGDIKSRKKPSEISAIWHNTFAHAAAEACIQAAKTTGIKDVVVSGGVFQNKKLLDRVYKIISSNGLNCYIHINIPSNDGGISLGQAYYRFLGL